jgi:3',5'-cyclic AMP phosphodiesterase CpdA
MDQDQGIRAGVRASLALDADFILHAGDLVQEGGRLSDWDELFKRLNDPVDGHLAARVPLIAVPGNHDYFGYGSGSSGFAQPSSEVHGMHKFLAHLVNPSNTAPTRRSTRAGHPSRTRICARPRTGATSRSATARPPSSAWTSTTRGRTRAPPTPTGTSRARPTRTAARPRLDARHPPVPVARRDLQQAQRETPFIFVFWHHAPWSQGPHNREPPADYQIGTPTRALDALLHRYGVTAVFNGHEEMIEHSETRGDPAAGG